jgi:hypothetical protein
MSTSRPGPPPTPPRAGAPGRRTAALLAVLLGVTSLVAGLTPIGAAGAQVAPAAVHASKTTAIDPDGETITITGTGFDPNAHVGTRPPLARQPSGVYVVFGRFANPWKPSESAPSSARETILQKWALPAAQKAILDPTGTNDELILLNPDGTFTATLAVAPGGTSAGDYAIAVYPGSGAIDATQEVLTPISFADPAPSWQPEVTVSKTAGIADAGETLTISGSGYDPAANVGTRPPLSGQASGFYVVYGRFGDPWKPSASAPPSARESLSQVWVLPAASRATLDPTSSNPAFATLAADGTFSLDLAVAPGGTSAGQYGIATYAGGGAVNADHELLTPISFASTPPPLPTPETGTGTGTGTHGQTLRVTPYSELDPDGQDLVVEGAGFDPAVGIYAALCVDQGPNLPPSPCVGGSGESSGSSSSAWITDNEQFASLRTAPFGAGGSFSVTLHVTAADESIDCYDAATTCVLATRADHTASANRTADVKVPVFFEGQTPVTPDPDPTPTEATVDTTTVELGGQMTVTGEGFIAGEQVQVWLHSEPQLMGVTVADALGKVSYTFTVPTTLEVGTHHVELYGITSALRLISPDFSVVAASVPAVAAAAAAATPPAAPSTTTTGTLPVTGSGPALPIAGVVLIGLGAVLAASAQRRARAVRADEPSITSTTTWERPA